MASDSSVVVAVEVLVGGRPAWKLLLHDRHQFLQYLIHLVASEQVRHLDTYHAVRQQSVTEHPDNRSGTQNTQ